MKVVDAEKKCNNNNYLKKFKIFGLTIFTHDYKLTWEEEDKKQEKGIGFKTHSS